MKRRFKFISVLLATSMIMSQGSVAFAEQASTLTNVEADSEAVKTLKVDGIVYNITKEPAYTRVAGKVVVGNNKDYLSSELNIPSSVYFGGITYNVVGIEDMAFENNDRIQTVTIGENVASLTGNAFANCKNLKEIKVDEKNKNYSVVNGVLFNKARTTLVKYPSAKEASSYVVPKNVTELSAGCFNNTAALQSVTLNTSLRTVGDNAFENCFNLQVISMPNDVEYFGKYAFANTKISEINFPRALKVIGEGCFESTNIKSAKFPSQVEAVESRVFYNCKNLSTVKLNSKIAYIGDYAFYNTAISKIELPASVESIGQSSFEGCKKLSSPVFPIRLQTIGKRAFYDCKSIKAIKIPRFVEKIGEDNFTGCDGLTNISVETLNEKYSSVNGALYNKRETTLIHYPSACEDKVFFITPSLRNIEKNALANCYNIEDFDMESNSEYFSVEDGILYNADGTRLIQYPIARYDYSFTLKETVMYIESRAFAGAQINGSFNISGSLVSIGESAFENCNKISAFSVHNTNKSFVSINGVLYNYDKTALIQYPIAKTDVEITIPQTVQEINDYAFYNSKLEKVSFNKNLKAIGNYAFANSALKEVVFTENIDTIGKYAFSGTLLGTVTIPKNIKQISDYAFSNAVNLRTITFEAASPANCGIDVFSGCRQLAQVNIPVNSLNSYKPVLNRMGVDVVNTKIVNA